MEEWKEYKIEELIDEISMGPFGSNIKVDNFIDFGVPVLNGSNMQDFKLQEKSFNYVSPEKADSLGRAIAYRGDVVITHRGTLGQIVYIPKSSLFERYVISQSQFRLKLKTDIVRPDYFVYYFHTPLGQHKILMNASQVGVPALARPTSTFKNVTISIPSIERQNKMMDILSSLDDKIEVNRRINEQLEELAQALFKSWFVDFEPFKDGEFVESELGMIPEGWNIGKFTDIIDIKGGGTPKTDIAEYWNGDIPFFTPKDINDVFCISTEKNITDLGLSKCSSKLYSKNTVFITARGTVGKVCMAGRDMAMNQTCYALIGKKNYGQHFIYMQTISIVERMKKKANGAVFSAITTRDFDSEKIIIPSLDIVSDYLMKIEPLYESILHNQQEITHLTNLRDTLLPKLMSGEIDVEQLNVIE